MAKALVAGGVRVLEVTLRTECAVDAIRAIAKEVPEAIVGAGTVLNPQQLAKSLKQVHSLQLARSDRAAAESCYRRDYSSDSGGSALFPN